ncbi:MAG: hypothetical protein KJ698_11560 [Actinobacteria bacterium]|nr:hypothetical protein [Actinomycetota bacterium]
MRIRADFGVGHPAADVWSLLASSQGHSCVPGLQVGQAGRGSFAFDVQARHLVFDGTAAVASDERARTITVEARGAEQAGRGKARTTLMVKVADDGLFSTVNVEADLHLTGEIASLTRLIAEAAYRIADQVAECLEARLGTGPPRVRPAAPPPPGEPEPKTGWLRRLAGRLGGG